MKELVTPVVLVIFNRPKTTQVVFEVIVQAKPKKLYIVSDGPRANRSGENKLVEQCREIVSRIDWPCEVFTKYSDKNLGCRESVVRGLDWVFSQEEEVIILEDDCVPTLEFFEFCQEMLTRYRNEPSVGTICGSNLEDVSSLETNFSYWFSRYPKVWGWATWKRAWVQYEVDLSKFSRSDRSVLVSENLSTHAARRYWESNFDSVASGKLDTWDYQLAFMHFKNNLVSVIPAVNLISNIGFGPDATHTVSQPANNFLATTGQLRWPLYGPTVAEPFEVYDELVVRNRFGLGPIKRIIDYVYMVSPRLIQLIARNMIAYLSKIKYKSK